jgi:hypothetical protein
MFDSVEWKVDMSGCLRKIIVLGSRLVDGLDKFEGGNTGHRPVRQGRLLPGPAGRQPARPPRAMCSRSKP